MKAKEIVSMVLIGIIDIILICTWFIEDTLFWPVYLLWAGICGALAYKQERNVIWGVLWGLLGGVISVVVYLIIGKKKSDSE